MASRDEAFGLLMESIDKTRLPPSHTTPLRAALEALHESRPTAVRQVQAPLGRALRNPLFPDIWTRAVKDIPDNDIYKELRAASLAIVELVGRVRRPS